MKIYFIGIKLFIKGIPHCIELKLFLENLVRSLLLGMSFEKQKLSVRHTEAEFEKKERWRQMFSKKFTFIPKVQSVFFDTFIQITEDSNQEHEELSTQLNDRMNAKHLSENDDSDSDHNMNNNDKNNNHNDDQRIRINLMFIHCSVKCIL